HTITCSLGLRWSSCPIRPIGGRDVERSVLCARMPPSIAGMTRRANTFPPQRSWPNWPNSTRGTSNADAGCLLTVVCTVDHALGGGAVPRRAERSWQPVSLHGTQLPAARLDRPDLESVLGASVAGECPLLDQPDDRRGPRHGERPRARVQPG